MEASGLQAVWDEHLARRADASFEEILDGLDRLSADQRTVFILSKLGSESIPDQMLALEVCQLISVDQRVLLRLQQLMAQADSLTLREAACDALHQIAPALLPKNAQREYRQRDELERRESLRSRWEINGMQLEADGLFRERDFAGFVKFCEPFADGLGEVMKQKFAYAKKQLAGNQ